jgi:hypothetical protein
MIYDLLEHFGDLHARKLEIFRINFGEIFLLTKFNQAN